MKKQQVKAWKAASRRATLDVRGKMVGKQHETKPTPRAERRDWKRKLVPARRSRNGEE